MKRRIRGGAAAATLAGDTESTRGWHRGMTPRDTTPVMLSSTKWLSEK